VKTSTLAWLACAATAVLAAPSWAATNYSPAVSVPSPPVDAFYASRSGELLWLREGPDSPAARELIALLRSSAIDGFDSGPQLAAQAQALMARARAGESAALKDADRLLSIAWVKYVQQLRRPPRGMTYADPWIAPRSQSADTILLQAAASPSLTNHLSITTRVNPFYSALREAALQSDARADPRLQASLERARAFPAKGRYIVVDSASARLWMVEDGRIADSMKVIVGKPSTQTPVLASVIYYATLNPYWNVPPDLAQNLIAKRVLSQGLGYLKSHNYQVLSGFDANAEPVPPDEIDWRAVADGKARVRIRQLPGPANSMGRVKFGFANGAGVFLHDTPNKDLFASDDRDLSNGCIRLEDADRLGRWLLRGAIPSADSAEPEQHVMLPAPVPIFITYMTAHADGKTIAFVDDVYSMARVETASR
jgi:murein L,D-transpeptidase YcbB/YkuD